MNTFAAGLKNPIRPYSNSEIENREEKIQPRVWLQMEVIVVMAKRACTDVLLFVTDGSAARYSPS